MKKSLLFILIVPLLYIGNANVALSAEGERLAPLEEKPNIFDNSKEGLKQLDAAVAITRNQGFICDSVGGFRPMITESGFLLSCNKYRYQYKIKDMGGSWVVSVDN